jgi:hypothetical protein
VIYENDKYNRYLLYFWKVLVVLEEKIVNLKAIKPPDLISMGLIELDYPIDTCPRCNHSSYMVNQGEIPRKINILKGPNMRYRKRENDLFFDLSKKFYECVHCGEEISVLDIQVLIESVSMKLPSVDARRFSMKMMGKYRLDPKSIREVIPLFVDDFEFSKDEPFAS